MYKGFSFYICIGKYAGFKVEYILKPEFWFRILLGFISISICCRDIEVLLEDALEIASDFHNKKEAAKKVTKEVVHGLLN